MNRKRATQNQNLFTAIESGTCDNPTPVTSEPTASARYVPVYHVELVRERSIKVEPRPSIHNSDDVVAILQDELLKSDREKLVCVMLSAKNTIIGIDIVSVGTLTTSVAHPREIFKSAILKNAASIILSHCHPSGIPTPSREDIQMTERIAKAGEILGIKLLDHIIIAEQGNYSFRNDGRLP